MLEERKSTLAVYMKKNRAPSWSSMPEVLESGVLENLNLEQQRLLEAKFEIITSEVTYLNNLTVLETHYMKNVELANILCDEDFRTLFGCIKKMRISSERLLLDMEDHWKQNLQMDELAEVLLKHVHDLQTFKNFVHYAKEYPKQLKCFKFLIDADGTFKYLVDTLMKHVLSQRLPIDSYFLIPIQRVAKYPLLIEAILKYLKPGNDQFEDGQTVLEHLKEIAIECDNIVQMAENRQMLAELSQTIRTPPDMRPIMIQGERRRLVSQNLVKNYHLTGKSLRREVLVVFVFSDMVVLTKREAGKSRNEITYIVKDYCNIAAVELITREEYMLAKNIGLTFTHNHNGGISEWIICFNNRSERQQWVEMVESAKEKFIAENPELCRGTSAVKSKTETGGRTSLFQDNCETIFEELNEEEQNFSESKNDLECQQKEKTQSESESLPEPAEKQLVSDKDRATTWYIYSL